MVTLAQAKVNRRKWINILKNDHIPQTTRKLADKEYHAFCCLGVAEEHIGPEIGIRRDVNGCYYSPHFDEGVTSGMMHPYLRKYLGLSMSQVDILANLNDLVGAKFSEIAQVIVLMDFFCDDGIFDRFGAKLN